jgi:hypothetical protein
MLPRRLVQWSVQAIKLVPIVRKQLGVASQERHSACQWAPVVQRCHKSESGGGSFPARFFASFRPVMAERIWRGRKEPSETSLIPNDRCHNVVNLRHHNNDQCSGQARSPGLQIARYGQARSPGLQTARYGQARSPGLQTARIATIQKTGRPTTLSWTRLGTWSMWVDLLSIRLINNFALKGSLRQRTSKLLRCIRTQRRSGLHGAAGR